MTAAQESSSPKSKPTHPRLSSEPHIPSVKGASSATWTEPSDPTTSGQNRARQANDRAQPEPAATAFEHLVDFGAHEEAGAELRHFTPSFDLHLVDLGTLDLPALDLDEPLAAIAVNLLHAVPRRDDLHEVLRAQRHHLRKLVAEGDRAALEATLTYIAQANPRADLQAVQHVMLTEVSAESEEVFVSTFQQIFEEREARGRQEGLVQGRQEGLLDGERKVLLKQLRLKFRVQVTPEVEARVAQGSVEDLERWVERLLVVDSLESVFAVGEA